MQQIRFENACTNEFQIISIGGSFIILSVIGLITERESLSKTLRCSLPYGVGAGLLKGAKNFVLVLAYLSLPISTVSLISAGLGIVLAFVVAGLVYKERYTLSQMLGVILGAVAVILLAI